MGALEVAGREADLPPPGRYALLAVRTASAVGRVTFAP